MVVPTENVEPGVCDLYQIRLPGAVQLSVASGSVQETTALQDPLDVLAVMLDGHPVMTGFWLSVTVTVKLHVLLVFKAASVAV